jgi:hypothetical protein
MKKTLKEDINDYYNAYHLPRRQLLYMQNLQKRFYPSYTRRSIFRKIWVYPTAAVILVIGAFILLKPLEQPTSINELIAEIAYNHNKRLDVEIKSNSLETVSRYLTKLDFLLIESERLPSDTWELIGGRYCSLKRQFAAQLKLRNKLNQKNYTHYQMEKPPNINDISGFSENFAKGVKVNLWLERGLILALAGDDK